MPVGRFLVTGAPGWLGTRLVEVLLHGMTEVPGLEQVPPGRTVRCLVQHHSDCSALEALRSRLGTRLSLELVPGDLRSRASLQRFVEDSKGATLVHCAGIIHPSRGIRQLYSVNVAGTRSLLNASLGAGITRFIHISSSAAMGANPSTTRCLDERGPCHPYRHYGLSKLEAEEQVRSHQGRGMETVILRAPWFYGSGQPARQSQLISLVRRGLAPMIGAGDNLRSMVYVDNLCQAILLSSSCASAADQSFWIADERPYTMLAILQTIGLVLERDFQLPVKQRQVRLPGLVAGVAGFADRCLQWAGAYHTQTHVLSELGMTIACSIEKARLELGYAPHIGLEEGMRRSIQWALAHGQRF